MKELLENGDPVGMAEGHGQRVMEIGEDLRLHDRLAEVAASVGGVFQNQRRQQEMPPEDLSVSVREPEVPANPGGCTAVERPRMG